MKKNLTVLFLFLLMYMSLNAQNKDSLIYILPDSVELKLYEFTKSMEASKYDCDFYLSSLGDNVYRINVSIYRIYNDDYWSRNTNRFLVINNKKYPLSFDYDSLFGTMTKFSDIGKMGEREGYIMRTTFINEGYNITFNIKGEILKENYSLFIKKN